MKVAFYMNCVSTHQLPLAKEVAARVDEFAYVYESVSGQVYQKAEYDKATQDKSSLETVDLVVSGLRDLELFERRARKGLKTFYTSERWFKPIPLRGIMVEKVGGGGQRKVTIRFVGSGPLLEKCQRLAEELKVDAEFRTEVRHEDLVAFYRGLDLFVLPSMFEGFGCAFTEAHSCGVPFITCEGQGMDDLIPEEDREKWLCKQNDPEDLARKIKDYISRVEHGERVEQRLNEDQDIDLSVGRFVQVMKI